jgi:hypothetical protein
VTAEYGAIVVLQLRGGNQRNLKKSLHQFYCSHHESFIQVTMVRNQHPTTWIVCIFQLNKECKICVQNFHEEDFSIVVMWEIQKEMEIKY